MSEASSRKREWHFYLDDMIGFARQAQAYTKGMNQEAFLENRLVYDATLRNLELIGEAATHIPLEVRTAHGHIPWRLIIATRNQLIHAYLGIDPDTVWSIVEDDLPVLLDGLERLKQVWQSG